MTPKKLPIQRRRAFAHVIVVFACGMTGLESSPTLEIHSRSTVFTYARTDPYDRQNLYGFNHAPSVVALPSGRLLAAWFSGPFEASVHQVILSSTSDDGGETWAPATVLHDAPRRSDFDPAFIADGKRTWFFYTVGRWDRYPFVGPGKVEKEEVGVASFKLYGRWSDNSGKNWSNARRLRDEVSWGCRSNGIRLSTGELVLPVYHFSTTAAAVLISSDGGASWERFGNILPPGKIGAQEPSVAELARGKLLMVVRTRDGFLWTARSTDAGRSWSKAENTGLTATSSSHSLKTTSAGHLLLTHNPCKPPHRTPLTMRVSLDGGRSWGTPLNLAAVEPPNAGESTWLRSVCYPSVTQLADSTLVVLWTSLEISATKQEGVIQAARVILR